MVLNCQYIFTPPLYIGLPLSTVIKESKKVGEGRKNAEKKSESRIEASPVEKRYRRRNDAKEAAIHASETQKKVTGRLI